jgi:hypothetical protein
MVDAIVLDLSLSPYYKVIVIARPADMNQREPSFLTVRQIE